MNMTTLGLMFYNLFVNYTFGSLELAFIGLFGLMAAILYKMNVSADGWLVFLIGFGATAGVIFISDMTLAVGIFIGVGILIAIMLIRMSRG